MTAATSCATAPDHLLDRIDPDLMPNPGAFADIEIERPGDHIADRRD
jgi:hypothetical protein